MFGTDEFGNNKLWPVAFAIVFALLSLGAIVTSDTMWTQSVAAAMAGH